MQLNMVQLTGVVSQLHEAITESVAAFDAASNIHMRGVASEIVLQVESFARYVPALSCLRHPGLQDRHWAELNIAAHAEQVRKASAIESIVKGQHGHRHHRTRPSVEFQTLPFFRRDCVLTLGEALSQGLHDHEAILEAVCGKAAKEFEIEKQLSDMVAALSSTGFDLAPHEQSQSYFVRGLSELLSAVDEQATVTQTLLSSPHHVPHEVALRKWARVLNIASDVIEEWTSVQQSWLQLWPLFFSSTDLPETLPTETKLFDTVHKFWHRTIAAIRRGRIVLTAHFLALLFVCELVMLCWRCGCAGDGSIMSPAGQATRQQDPWATPLSPVAPALSPSLLSPVSLLSPTSNSLPTMSLVSFVTTPMLLDRFKECRRQLEQIQRGLHKFLQSKRHVFPRFYFLSDDELLLVRKLILHTSWQHVCGVD